ncbi:MAG: hypothetical protein ACJ8FS_03395 [Sphingomicrobium sp.]
MFDGNLEDAAAQAEKLLRTIVAGAVCVAQVWDDRVDCVLRLSDGTLVGEMVSAGELTVSRIRATGERLRQRAHGVNVPLVNEVRQPTRMIPPADE